MTGAEENHFRTLVSASGDPRPRGSIPPHL